MLCIQKDHCSDYLVHTTSQVLDGHNEDGGPESINNTFVVHANISGSPNFVAYTCVPIPASWIHAPSYDVYKGC